VGKERIAVLLGCAEARPLGKLPEPGSTLAGFRILASEAARDLVLRGAHRFARYELSFRVDEGASA